MENEINVTSENINSLLKQFSAAKNTDTSNIEKTIKDSLTPEQQSKINSILSDPDRLKRILSSPQAKMILDMIKDKKE